MCKIEEKLEKLEKQVYELNEYKEFRNWVIEKMQWNAMDVHEPDDDHEERWFTEPIDEDTYFKPKYDFYQKILTCLDKEFLKDK